MKSPMVSSNFTCFVIGDDTLLTQCSQILLDKGQTIFGVITSNPKIELWAKEKMLPCFKNDLTVIEKLRSKPFDYLFSIANLKILPAEILSLPRKGAINFHDGPLPEYAGLNATSWAIINGEKSHGITWHFITDEIDKGDILCSQTFEVAEDETAFTLNTKCFEEAFKSFGKLVDDLIGNTTIRIKQEFQNRSYFGKHKKPSNACVISWQESAESISVLVRGLNFERYSNPLGSAKIKINDEFYIVKNAAVVEAKEVHRPGIMLEYDEKTMTIAAKADAVKLYNFESLDGKEVLIKDIIDKFELKAGYSLEELLPSSKEAFTQINNQYSKYENFWSDKLKQLEKIDVDLKYNELIGSNGNVHKKIELIIPQRIHDTVKLSKQFSYEDFIKISFAFFIGKLKSKKSFDIGYAPLNSFSNQKEFEKLFAATVPLKITIDYENKCSDLIESEIDRFNNLKRKGTYIKDIIARTPDLIHSVDHYLNFPVLIKDINKLDEYEDVTAKLTLLNVMESAKFYWIYNINEISEEVIKVLCEHFIGYLTELLDGLDKCFFNISLLTEIERNNLLHLWNETDSDYPNDIGIHQLFETQALLKRDTVALVCNGVEISYSQLNNRADLLAGYLNQLGVKANTFIGISLNRSTEMMVAILGIFKAGCTYVPLDPDFPEERISLMIEDSGCSVLITESKLSSELKSDNLLIVNIDSDWDKISASEKMPVIDYSSTNLCYLIYTSGSTGKPKGVKVTHRNVVNFFTAMDQQISYDENSVWLAVTSLSFDISVLELLWTLTRGMKVVIYAGDDIKVTSHQNVNETKHIDFSLFYFSSYEGEKDTNKYDLLLEGSKYADKNNFTAVWTPERHFYDFGGLYPNPSITSAAIAALTERIKIRAGSVVSPLHNTIRIAEEWSMVDNLSQGRVGVSFAAGWQPNDFVIKPENFKDRKELMFRQIEEVQKLWQGEKVGFTNPNGKVIEINILPKPVQEKLPVWVTAAGNPETFEMAGRLGHNLLTHLLGQSISELAEKISIYRKAWKEAGHKGKGILTLMLHTFVGTDEKMVKETVRGPMKHYLQSSVNLVKEAAWSFPTFKNQTTGTDGNFSLDHLSSEDLDAVLDYSFERYYQTSGLFGTPESCKKIIKNLKETDVDEIACLIDFGVDSDMVMAHLHYLNQVRREANIQAPVSAGENKYTISSLIKDQKVTHMQCTPSMAQMLVTDEESKESLRTLQTMLIGGEAFPVKLAESLMEVVKGDILNMYGPTETTVWSTVYRLKEPVGKTIPIGKPIANTQIYILDSYRQLVPVGIAGELCIGGDGVTEGYYNRPELTAEKFIDNPFSNEENSKLYRTGDLAYYRKDGTIEFLGRLDHQVKIRGYRIELGEIETALSSHEQIREAVVIAREDTPGDVRLVAYVILKNSNLSEIDKVKSFFKRKLPEYMIPSQYLTVESFPLTPNGKINRKAFPVPSEFIFNSEQKNIALPTNELEIAIASIWQNLLKLPKVGINDNFFDIGGHSLLAVQLHAKLKKAIDSELSLTDIFRFSTIKAISEFLENKKSNLFEIVINTGSKRGEMSKLRISRSKNRERTNSRDVNDEDFE